MFLFRSLSTYNDSELTCLRFLDGSLCVKKINKHFSKSGKHISSNIYLFIALKVCLENEENEVHSGPGCRRAVLVDRGIMNGRIQQFHNSKGGEQQHRKLQSI